ncbi:MAG: DUF4931 domain-containing protein [Nitrospinota bacterium]
MSELRNDPIQRRWVIISSERKKRPSDFKPERGARGRGGSCPFDEGKEGMTPPEVFALRAEGSRPDGPGWLVRVVPNRFPALTQEGGLKRERFGLYDVMDGVGAHEVIVETPVHEMHMADMGVEHLARVLSVYQARLLELFKDPRFRYVLIFKNHGRIAGASLTHPHTQLIATPITPRTVAMELLSALEHYRAKECCLFCDIIGNELTSGERVVAQNSGYVAIAPFASRFPFELFIAPRVHGHSFAALAQGELTALASFLKDIIRRVRDALDDPPYNYLFHIEPNVEARPRKPGYWETLRSDFHWHIEIIPRLTRVAGFEWGTGFYINPVAPEEAARVLRETG